MQKTFQCRASYEQIADCLKEIGSKMFMLVCGKNSFDALNIQSFLDSECPDYIRFSDFSSNPKYEQVCKGIEKFNSGNCDTIVAIGGGSAMDIAKCIKLFCKMKTDENFLNQEFSDTGVPLIAVPTTAGTGSESTRYAVIYYNGEKQSITHNSIVPNYAILDASLLKTLPLYQKKCAMLDALCQGVESWWSVNSTDESKDYSKVAVETIMQNWRQYIFKDDREAAELIMIGSNYAGRAINITQTTAAHAMSYKITSLYNFPHGYAVGVCLPAVWEIMLTSMDKCVDSRGSAYLNGIFYQIADAMEVTSPPEAIELFREMMREMELLPSIVGHKEDLSVLSSSVNPIRLKNNPIGLNDDSIRRIYGNILL